ncbi:hypothetical protein BN2537_545 [Streptomyces venezuelae]|nr:hypothetical protein BN2537_545 [Streptomyces venezuelae]
MGHRNNGVTLRRKYECRHTQRQGTQLRHIRAADRLQEMNG